MFILAVVSNYDNEINDVIGVFDTYEKAQEKQQELKLRFDSEYRLYVIKYTLNVVEEHDIESFLKEESE